MMGTHRLAAPEQGEELDQVSQLANVPWPWIGADRRHRGACHSRRRGGVLGRELLEKQLDERAEVGLPVPQRWNGEGDPLDAVVEVRAEAARLHVVFQRSKRRANET